ncbi:MAG: FtsX-like permease family protein, partial [Bryobacteraceae bacterium]
LLQGRDFRETDAKGAAKVAIINEKFARRYFKDGNALGHHVGLGGDPGTPLDTEIVGIVRDTKYENLRKEVPVEAYLPYLQVGLGAMQAYIHAGRDPERVFAAAREAATRLDPQVPVFEMKTIDRQIEESLAPERAVAALATAFGFLAALLAAIGLYGVMAYSVARRTREIGVRIALGAGTGDVIWLVLKEVAALASIGIGIGLISAWGLTRFVKSQLYGIAPTDVMTLIAAAMGIACVALIAGYLPARRAARVDPMTALRVE